MHQLRIGVIGTGGISQFHIEGIQKSPDAVLTALCDIDPAVLAQNGIKHGIPQDHLFSSHTELLSCPDVDAVSICTPNDAHFMIAMDAVRFGKPFALEKPVTLNAGQAGILLGAVSDAKLPNMVCFSYRFKASARYVRQMIWDGELGRIYHVYAQYFQSWAMDGQLPLIWRFRKAVTGSGALGDLGSHLLDLVCFMVGDIQKVCGQAGTFIADRKPLPSQQPGRVDVDDYFNIMAQLEGGIPALLAVTRFAHGRGNHQRIEIYGEKGSVIYSLEDADTVEVCMGAPVGNAGGFVRVEVPESYKSDQMQSFIDRINGRDDGLAATMLDGYANQVLLDSVLESFEKNQWISI